MEASVQQHRRELHLLAFAATVAAVLWLWTHPGSLLGDRAEVLRVRVVRYNFPGKSSSSSGGGPDGAFSVPAALHGAVHKAGPLDGRQWLERYATQRHSRYYAYLEKGQRQHPFGMPPTSSLPSQQPVTFPKCQVWVNHEYKLLYLRHAKAGSTSVLTWFGKGSPAKLRLLDTGVSAEEVARMWQDYFVFTAVRNPFSRAVSQYKFLLRKMHARPECEQMVSWDRFCAFPPSMGLACRRRPECCVMNEGFAYIHLISQAACMTTEDGGLAVDYVVRVGLLDEEMGGLFAEINRRRPQGLAELVLPKPERLTATASSGCDGRRRETETYEWGGKTHVTLAPREQYCDTAEYFSGKHPRCLDQLNAFMEADLRLLMGLDALRAGDATSGGSGKDAT